MQNKGFVKVFAIALTIVCLFYLSFTFKTRGIENRAAKSPMGEQAYLDSIMNETVWLGLYTYKECREMQIGLGLDLKGGMNVILEVSVADVIKSLANHTSDPYFNSAVSAASKRSVSSQDDFVTIFVNEYKKIQPEGRLNEFFATSTLKDQITVQSSDEKVISVLKAEVAAAIDNSFNVLRTRIDRFGVAQPNIQELTGKQGRIMIELPGIKEPERVRKLLQGSANLEFWETYKYKEIVDLINLVDRRLRDSMPEERQDIETESMEVEQSPHTSSTLSTESITDSLAQALLSRESTEQAITEAQKAEFRKNNPLLSRLNPPSYQEGCIVGISHYNDTADVNRMLNLPDVKSALPRDLKLLWGVKAIDKKEQYFELYAIKSTQKNNQAALTGDVVTKSEATFDQFNNPCVSMSMNTEGSRRWAQLTKQNINRNIAIVLDNYVYSAPNVSGEISGGSSQITGNFTVEDTQDLANVLKSGKMQAPAKIVQEDIVGPSLGQESIRMGLISFIVAFVLLMIYMCSIYGFIPGMIANGALFINFFFTLGILTSFQAALTMSGIAGIVLTLGMAVDANVLIYERTKEELRLGKGVKSALNDGYKNAFSAIFDSNLTSIITGVILFYFGTGPIRGFATTLIIGITCSFFSAVFLTRVVYEHFLDKGKFQNLTFITGLSKNLFIDTKLKFMDNAKKYFISFGVAIIISFAFISIRGLSKSIDFTGGRNFVVQFEQQVEPETVRGILQTVIVEDNVRTIALGTDRKTIRVTTNYRIDEDSDNIDSEIEEFLFTSLKEAGLLSPNLDLATFIDRDNRIGGSIISSQKVGPSIAKDITRGAIISVILALIAIFLYILLRFRNVAYSIGSIAALAIDTLLIIGMYSICWGWMPFSLEIDQTFIGAILTAIGYSINDKVVVFDRIREYNRLYPKRDKKQLFNDALNTTLSRTLNTSFSTLIVLLCIFFLGGDNIRSFSFAMILGVVFGTLSSLLIAAPTAYRFIKKNPKLKVV
ncbi:MAG TPA: protein translocase subunit SecDF [Bacteroidaceae bacterium]|nr:protein translocase subunit SecDF [Bacteroidaceae bacterium]